MPTTLDHPRLAAAVRYLIKQINTDDLEHLCWVKLALDLYRHLPNVEQTLKQIDAHIHAAEEKRRQTGWLKPNCYRQALTILALGVESRNFFRVPIEAGDGKQLGSLVVGARTDSLVDRVGKWYQRFVLWALSA